jgi:hypothetical protein
MDDRTSTCSSVPVLKRPTRALLMTVTSQATVYLIASTPTDDVL